jgi:hypothetical protein
MGRVLTNNTATAVAKEESRGVLPVSPVWKSLEPNDLTDVGAELTTVPRSPISKNRQRRKGVITDLDSSFGYACDMTLDLLVDFIEGFLYATSTNNDLTFVAAPATASGYTIPAATAAQAAKLQFTAAGPSSLVYGKGYANAANNGLKILTADTGLAGVLITVAGNVAETPPTNAEVSIAGIRAEAGDLAITVSAGVGTLTSGNGASVTPINFTTLGLTVGQSIHVGGLLAANRFGATVGAGSNDSFGRARIRTIAAGALSLDKLDPTLLTSDGTDTGSAGAEVSVDLLFGRFIRNVPVDDAAYLEQYFQFELEVPNLYETDPPTPVAEPNGYIYAIGNLSNELVWELPLTDKSTATVGFIGTDTENPVDGASRKTNAATPIAPLFTGAFSTSTDIARLRLADVDDTGLSTDFKDLTATLNNNVGPEKVLGVLGARFLNNGNFEVDVDATVLFTDPEVPARIRDNTTVTLDWLVKNDDGAIFTDIPSLSMGSDGYEFPVNESVRLALTCTAFVDTFFGTSLSVSLFPVYP